MHVLNTFFILIFLLKFSDCGSGVENEELQILQSLLLNKFPVSPIELLNSIPRDSSDCSRDLKDYGSGIINLSGWALQMLDATAKIPEGLLLLNHDYLGQYDQCLKIHTPNFQGQHCLLKGELHLPEDQSIDQIPSKLPLVLFYGICLPSSCSAAEINSTLSVIGDMFDGLITIEANEQNCFIDKKPEFESADWVAIWVLLVIGFAVAFSTIYEIRTMFNLSNDKPDPLLASFSLFRNLKSLFGGSNNKETMGCIHGLRTISMAWVVIFHLFQTLPVGPLANVLDAFQAKKSSNYVLVEQGYIAVDTFLVITGLLITKSFLSGMQRTGTHDAPMSYIHRYFRLTPSYAIVLLFHLTLFRYIGDGPMYNVLQNEQQENCNKWWWTSLLYVQNYVNPDELCLTQTWYLSIDMQLYWIAPIVLYPVLFFKQIVGICFYIALSIVFTVLPFAIAIVNGFAAHAEFDTTGKQNRLDYYATHSRLAPWFVGIALGYWMHAIKTQGGPKKHSKIFVAIGWIITTGICLSTVLGLIAFEESNNISSGVQSFYLTFHRLGWAIGIAWIIYACTYGYGGIINHFLSWSFFEPLGKLSYGVYLCHVSLIMYRLGVARTTLYLNQIELVFLFLQIFLVSNFLAILLYVFIEAPFFNLERYLLRDAKIFSFRHGPRKSKNAQV